MKLMLNPGPDIWRKLLPVVVASNCAYLGHTCNVLAAEQQGEKVAQVVSSDTTLDNTAGAAADPAPGDGNDLGLPSMDFQDSEENTLVVPDAGSYQFYIVDLENRFGPYAPGLPEQLLGLGSAYQRQGLHQAAVDTFKRGIHIARINEGLLSERQIPLLRRLIHSLVELRDFETADAKHDLLYRVQTHVYGTNSKQMSAAMLEQAEWERRAYDRGLYKKAFLRLLKMWDLYSAVLRNTAAEEGSRSTKMLRPLEGLLQTQYRTSTYRPEMEAGAEPGSAAETYFIERRRFRSILLSNHEQGQRVILAMRDIYADNEGEQSPLPAEMLVRLGDWHSWYKKSERALRAYQQAWDELGELDDAARLQQLYFGEPTLLPDTPGSRRDLTPPETIAGYAQVTYRISPAGRVKRLDILNLEPIDKTDTRQPVRLLRQIKQMQYRPRFENGYPVYVDDVRKRYAY